MEERSHSYEQGDMCNPKNDNSLLSHNLVQTAEESRENVQHEEERESDSNRPLGPTFDVHVSEPLEQGVCGLRNLGNTCYMNAGLQCLISLPAICQHFLQERQSSSEESNLSAPFRNLLLEVWGNKRTDFRPEDFKSSLGTKFSQFEGYRQHDCQEFIALLLSSLHDELKAKKPQAIEGSSSGANRGALESIGAAGTADEDLDEDELRKIEHKNQDEIVSTATSISVANNHAFALATSVPMDIEGQEAVSTEMTSKFSTGGVNNGMGATITDERQAERSRQVSPSNVMKKMKLDSDFIDYSPPPEVNNAKSAGDSFSPQTDFYSSPPAPPHNSHEDEFNVAHGLNKFAGIDENGAFIKPHWDMGDNEQDEVVKRKKGSDASTFRPYKEPVKEKASSKTVESIIAQTFQGQFRNTVCCDGCGDISTTDEPFMYVPVPLPGALDKNFPLFLIPEDPNSPKITFQVKAVNKHGTVGDMRAKMLKQLMAAQIKLEGMDVLIALGSRNATTGFCGSVDRFLEDSVQLANLPSSGSGSENGSNDSSVSMGIMTSYYNASSSYSNSKDALYFAFVKSRNPHSKQPAIDGERASTSACDDAMRGGGGEIERDVEGHEERGEREEEHGEREPESGEGTARDERTTAPQEVNSWKTCCICMDDRFDDDLRSHHCGCYLCLDCFQRTKEQQQQSPEQTQMDAALAQFGGACNDEEDMDIMGAIAMEQMNAAGDSTSDDTYSLDNPTSSNVEEMNSRNKPPVSMMVKCPMCNLMEDEDTGFPFVGKRGAQTSPNAGAGDQEEGIKSSSGSGSGRGTRLMMLTVFYRVFNSDSGKVEIVDWPRLVYMFDSVSKRDALETLGRQSLSEVTRYLDFSMHRTESSGLKCSRCYKLASEDKDKQLCDCSWLGASWDKDVDNPIDFIPGDSIAIQFYGVAADQLPCLFMPCESLEEEEQTATSAPNGADRADGSGSMSSSSTQVVNGSDGDGMLTLEQCIEAFTGVEQLEDGEEWWCGRCEASRAARRQMSLLDMPETLVIYLKRFHFHSGTMRSYKLHNPVSCPTLLHIPPSACTSSLLPPSTNPSSSSSAEIEGDLKRRGSNKEKREGSGSSYVSGSNQQEQMEREEEFRGAVGVNSQPDRAEGGVMGGGGGVTYQLQSYVCHIGESVNSGHYTAFARNALSGQWYYFNDETVTLVEGSPNCHNNRDIYILFYQRIDCSYNISIPPPPSPNTAPAPPLISNQRPHGRVRSDSTGDNSHQQKNNSSLVSPVTSTNSGALMLYDPALARSRTSSG